MVSDILPPVTTQLRANPWEVLNTSLAFILSQDPDLYELEFFRKSYADQTKSYEEFQEHFEAEFGKPNFIQPGTEGFDRCTWNLQDVEIVHYVFDRFGPEEHMRIRKRK